jgi:hypothetical protein
MRRLWIVGVAISAVLLSSPSAPGRSQGTTAWSGRWTTAWGDMTLTQDGMKVEGTYPHEARHIVGTVSGDVFSGRWDGTPMRKEESDAGAVVLTLKADGRSFSGRSNSDGAPNAWSTEWSGTCVSGRCLAGGPTNCTKTYVIQPSGQEIVASIKLTELSSAAIADLRKREDEKYGGYPYTPVGAETRKQNCAGLVFQTLFPGVVQQGNVEPDGFFRKLVQRYGVKVTSRKKGDVVVYRASDGVVKHVAIVESAVDLTKILTKDGNERPYVGSLPREIFADDPLINLHAGQGGRVEFWRIDRSKLRIEEVSSGECDDTKAAEPTKLTLTVEPWSLTATKAKPAVYLHHEQDEPLASKTKLTINVSIDHPLPKGWKLTVYHNGDVLSQGNGVWYKVCEVVAPNKAITCGDTRPGRVGPFDDLVYATLTAPTYLAMHSDISFHFNPP